MEENKNLDSGIEVAESAAYSAPAQTAPVPPKKRSSAGKIAAIVLALIAAAGAAFAAGRLLPGKEAASPAPAYVADAVPQETQRTVPETKRAEKKTEAVTLTAPENHGIPMPGGRYIVGEDIPAGKYLFVYKTNLSDLDYMGFDYLWVTYAGSEGKNETFGGDFYDDRVGSVQYKDACAGKSFYFNLHEGDSLLVDSEYGEWTY